MEFVEHSVENATDEEFMSLQQHIQEQIQEQCAKHERIDLVPAEVANTGVRVACAVGISDLCQKNSGNSHASGSHCRSHKVHSRGAWDKSG